MLLLYRQVNEVRYRTRLLVSNANDDLRMSSARHLPGTERLARLASLASPGLRSGPQSQVSKVRTVSGTGSD